MKYETFKERLVKVLCEVLTDLNNVQLEEKKVLKVNQSFDSISIVVGNDVVMAGPTIYVQELYRFYTDVVDENFEATVHKAVILIMRGLLMVAGQNITQKADTDSMKEKPIIPQVINAGKNKELLESVPHRMIEGLDLAIVYRLLLDIEEDGYSSTIVTNELACEVGKTETELYIQSNETVMEILPCEIVHINEDFCVVTTEKKVTGAYYGFNRDVLTMISSEMNSDLYIIPSSLDECFILSAEYNDKEYIKSVIIEANTSVVSEDEFLSNNLYMYLRNENKLVIA